MVISASAGDLIDLKEWEKQVTKHVLKNGLTVLVVERHEVPTVSFVTYAKVGSVDEVVGGTGLAHLFEHLAFKGTTTIGTTNYAEEQRVMDEMEDVYEALKAERWKGPSADQERIKRLAVEFQSLKQKAGRYTTKEYDQAIEQAGAQGYNAYTSYDQTVYYYSLPSNKVELWMALESERFLHPVLRDFYKERDVVMEERRRSREDNQVSKLYMKTMSLAYDAHPYGVDVIGYMSDIASLTRRQAEAFFADHYTPDKLVVAVVGDVQAKDVIAMAETYFGRLPARTRPARRMETIEPPQQGEKRITMELPAQPYLMIGFHLEGNAAHPDWPVYKVLLNALINGRASRLERVMVQEKQVATGVGGTVGPGRRYPPLFLFFVSPAPGRTTQEAEALLCGELTRLGQERVDQPSLDKAKRQETVSLLRALGDHHAVAEILASAEGLRGDWREAFRSIERVQQVTGEDVKRVAAKIFVKSNRTVGIIETAKEAKQANEANEAK